MPPHLVADWPVQAPAVLLGLPAAAGQPVRAGLGDQPDGRGRLDAVPVHRRHRAVARRPDRSGRADDGARPCGRRRSGNAVYSVQRYPALSRRPRRAGRRRLARGTDHADPAVDPRYGYTEQIVVPGTNSQALEHAGSLLHQSTAEPRPTITATQPIYHTLGWANEYEQGSRNGLAEPWDYFPFNDRDFTSVAELMLVPGCSPGLFTKQFVEFAPSYANIDEHLQRGDAR